MFQHMFASMNEMLDRMIERYSGAKEQDKQQLEQQWSELKKMSDSFIEQWLEFEEKLADFKERQLEQMEVENPTGHKATNPAVKSLSSAVKPSAPPSSVCNMADLEIPDEAATFIYKGHGYYKLFMFPQAAMQFQDAMNKAPECNLARLFLGMTHMHLQNWNEAQRHFQLLIVLTDFPKWLAMGYNALGCIQAVHMNLARAEQLFMKAYDVCPSFKDPLNNLRSCKETPSQLSLYFGSTELCCL